MKAILRTYDESTDERTDKVVEIPDYYEWIEASYPVATNQSLIPLLELTLGDLKALCDTHEIDYKPYDKLSALSQLRILRDLILIKTK